MPIFLAADELLLYSGVAVACATLLLVFAPFRSA